MAIIFTVLLLLLKLLELYMFAFTFKTKIQFGHGYGDAREFTLWSLRRPWNKKVITWSNKTQKDIDKRVCVSLSQMSLLATTIGFGFMERIDRLQVKR